MDQGTTITTNSPPTFDAEVIRDPDLGEDELTYDVEMALLDHLPVGGRSLALDGRADQYYLIAIHSPSRNTINITWASPGQIKAIEGGSRADAYEFTHPRERDGFEDWERDDKEEEDDLD